MLLQGVATVEFADVEAAKKAVEIKERMLDNSKASTSKQKASKASKAQGHQ